VKGSSSARVLLGAGTVLAAVLAVLFWRALFQDRVLAPTDLIFTSPFFADQAPPGFSHPSNPLLYDQVYQFAPWRRFARESLLSGHLPLWNPHSLSGTPFIATQQTAIFYPINLLLLAVPFERTFVWSAILRLWTAGMLTFLLARRLGLSPPSALIPAFGFMLSGFLIVGIGHSHTGAALWLPGIVLGAELAVTARTRAAGFCAVALLALVVGVQFTAGHIETSVDMVIATTLYLLIRWHQLGWSRAQTAKAKLQPLLLFAAGVTLGTGLGAAQLLPFLEWLPLSEEAGASAPSNTLPLLDLSSLKNLAMLPLFVFPNMYNRPTWDTPYFNFLPWGHSYHSDMLYVGLLTFLLAIVALLRSWRAVPVVRAWGLVFLIAMGRALYLPVFDWFNHLPLLELGKPHMFRLIGSFSVCLLGGFGAQALFADGTSGKAHIGQLWRHLCAGVIVGGVVLMLVGKIVLPASRDWLIAHDREAAVAFDRFFGNEPRPPQFFDPMAQRMADNTIMAFRLRNVGMYAPAAIAAAALLVGLLARRRGWSRQLRAAMVVLAAGDLLGFAWGYNPTIVRRDFYPAPPIVDTLARDTTLFRFSATSRDLNTDAHMMFGLSDVRGYDFPTLRYATYAGLVPEHVLPWRNFTFAGFDSPLLRVLNLKYVFADSQRVPLSPELVARVIPAGRGRLWELRDPQPRSFMVYQERTVRTDDEAAELLRRQPDAVFSRVLLSADQRALPADIADTAEGRGAADVSAIEYGAQRAVWRVKTDRAGYLFTGDSYYPGWRAELDGRPTTIYRANLAFRAVRVPAGEHVIVHRFEPLSVRIGLAVTAGSLAGVLALLLAAWRGVSRSPR
jgi:hypothetical protein